MKSALKPILWALFAGCLFLAPVAVANDTLEQQITNVLKALRTVVNPNPPDSPFKPFVVLESNQSGRFLQFRQSMQGTFYVDVPLDRHYQVDGEPMIDSYLDSDTADLIRQHFVRWGMEPRELTTKAFDPDGGRSEYRSLDVDITIDPENYGKFAIGVFTDCYGESEPLDISIIYEPEG